MEKIIKKAIEGGYDNQNARYIKLGTEDQTHCNYSNIVLDPLFWQALSKSCEWGSTGIHKACLCGKEKHNNYELMEWHINASNFYEINIIEGWEKAVEWLEEIIK